MGRTGWTHSIRLREDEMHITYKVATAAIKILLRDVPEGVGFKLASHPKDKNVWYIKDDTIYIDNGGLYSPAEVGPREEYTKTEVILS